MNGAIAVRHKLFALVSLVDYHLIKYFSWYPIKHEEGKTYYVEATLWHGDKKRHILMHRLIMHRTMGKLEVDHINGSGLDNRQSNLRPATKSQNLRNRRKFKNSSSQYIGVTFNKRLQLFRSYVKTDDKTIIIGHYESEREAGMARDLYTLKYNPEFGVLNFPKLDYTNMEVPKSVEMKRKEICQKK